jgi:anti-sigma factor RsiW
MMTTDDRDERGLDVALKDSGLRYAAPPGLAGDIRQALARERPVREAPARAGGWWHWLTASGLRTGMAFACGVLLSALVTTHLPGANTLEDTDERELVSAHVRSLMVAHLEDVASSDQHTVKPWFSGKLDFAPPVVDLSRQGFVLSGGRLDYLQDRPVAALVYRYQKHVINLFLWPAQGNPAADQALRAQPLPRGYRMVGWREDGLEYRAVSDAGLDALRQFAANLRSEGKLPAAQVQK